MAMSDPESSRPRRRVKALQAKGKPGQAKAKPLARALPTAPAELLEAQAWFGQAISHPLNGAWRTAADGAGRAHEAGQWLRGSEAMPAFDRLEVYNRQYWFRLISVMQFDYACTLHVMGLARYNAWAIRYLAAHPPSSPYLNDLDARFSAFLGEHYHEADRTWVLEAAVYDRAYAQAFEAVEGEPLGSSATGAKPLEGDALMRERLALAPHVTPLRLTYDWASYRALALEDESLEAVLPQPVPKEWQGTVFREGLQLSEKAWPKAAMALLDALRGRGTLGEIIDRIIAQLDETSDEGLAAELEAHLSEWLADFVARGWVVRA